MEDYKDRLAQLKAQIEDQNRIKFDTVLNVGDIVVQRTDLFSIRDMMTDRKYSLLLVKTQRVMQ